MTVDLGSQQELMEFAVNRIRNLKFYCEDNTDMLPDLLIKRNMLEIFNKAVQIYDSNKGCPICGNEKYGDD